MSLLAKLLLSVGVVFYVVLIPYLEWNQSHVFNPDWPPHARFHEVWQLITNVAFGLLALWLTWVRQQFGMAAIISTIVMGGVIGSHLLADHVGSSVQSGNIATEVLGLDLAVFVAIVVVVISLLAAMVPVRKNRIDW